VIVKSQAQLAASLRATWTTAQLDQLRLFFSTVEARDRAKGLAALRWPGEQDKAAAKAAAPFIARGAVRRDDGLLVASRDLIDAGAALSAAGVGPVSVTRLDYVFEPACPAVDALQARLGL